MKIGFTGTRHGMTPQQIEALNALLPVADPTAEFHHGDCLGADAVAQRIAQHQAAGYDVHGYYMFVPPEEAALRAAHRFYKNGKANGRYVPPKVVLANQTNEQSFDKAKASMKKWAIYSYMTKAGPQLVSQGEAR